MFVLALVIVILAPPRPAVHAGGPAPVRRRLEPGGGPPGRRRHRRVQFAAFAVCGALAGFAGFLFVGRFGTINVTAGSGLELAAIAAAVVGGVSTLGGSGTVLGAFLGAVLIGVLDQSLVRVEQISEFWRGAILGTLILLAVLLDVTVGRRLRERARTSRGSTPSSSGSPCSLDAAPHVGTPARGLPARHDRFQHLASAVTSSVDNFVNLFQLHIEKVIVVVMMTFVIIAGEIDFSVASVMAWSASVLASLHEHGIPSYSRSSPPSPRRPSPG